MSEYIWNFISGVLGIILAWATMVTKNKIEKKKIEAEAAKASVEIKRADNDHDGQIWDEYKEIIKQLRQTIMEYGERIEQLESELEQERKERLEAGKEHEIRMAELNKQYLSILRKYTEQN